MEKKIKTTGIIGVVLGDIGIIGYISILGLYKENGKENKENRKYYRTSGYIPTVSILFSNLISI